MPITTANQLEALRAEVREAIIHSIAEALALLTKDLPVGRAKHTQVLLLTSRANDVANHDVGNTLPPHLLDVLRNELRSDILTFTDHLTLADFGPEAPARPELKPGHLLYKVSPKMALRETYECLIRIAHQLSHVLAGIELDDSVSFEELPVAEVMEVEVIDPSPEGNPAFDILLLSDGEQLVDEFSATDWVFNVRPLRAGEHRLVLKISVLITVGGKERTKNIVLQRPISVVTEVAETESDEFIRVAEPEHPSPGPADQGDSAPPVPYPTYEPTEKEETAGESEVLSPPKSTPSRTETGGGIPPVKPPIVQSAPASKPPVRGRSRRMRHLSVAASVLLVVSFAWWLLPMFSPGDDKPVVTPPPPDSGDVVVPKDGGEDRDSLERDSLRFK